MLWLALAVACFNAAYASVKWPIAGLLIFGYAIFLVRLTDQSTVRRAFYFGFGAGMLCVGPQLFFFWRIFGPAAIVIWIVLAFWIGLFTAISCGCIRRWGRAKAAWLIPVLWTGIEYFRSELYYLRFSWLNVGYALPPEFSLIGMYGIGFVAFAIGSAVFVQRPVAALPVIGILSAALISVLGRVADVSGPSLSITGIQMEFPSESILPLVLDQALKKHPEAPIFVLSEYTLDGPVPDSLKRWCREHSRYLVVGGKDPAGKDNFYNTAFVVGTNGDVIFKQVKSVPIQFFKDGLPAPKQECWNSPWGKIGICICYDLAYTRVTDRLVREGAQLLIVPTMDVEEWGRHEHELHSRVAPLRAAECRIPIFRVASSGVSQAVAADGHVIAQTSMPGVGQIISAKLRLVKRGSVPVERYFAQICVGVTGIVTVVLLFLTWRDGRGKAERVKANLES